MLFFYVPLLPKTLDLLDLSEADLTQGIVFQAFIFLQNLQKEATSFAGNS